MSGLIMPLAGYADGASEYDLWALAPAAQAIRNRCRVKAAEAEFLWLIDRADRSLHYALVRFGTGTVLYQELVRHYWCSKCTFQAWARPLADKHSDWWHKMISEEVPVS